MLQPANPARGNRRLFFEVVNRGRIRAFRMFDGVAETPNLTREEHIGNGFSAAAGLHARLVWLAMGRHAGRGHAGDRGAPGDGR